MFLLLQQMCVQSFENRFRNVNLRYVVGRTQTLDKVLLYHEALRAQSRRRYVCSVAYLKAAGQTIALVRVV